MFEVFGFDIAITPDIHITSQEIRPFELGEWRPIFFIGAEFTNDPRERPIGIIFQVTHIFGEFVEVLVKRQW